MNETVVTYLTSHAEEVAIVVTEKMERENPELFRRYERSERSAADPRAHCRQDTVHHLQSLAAALDIDDAGEFEAYTTWLVKLLETRGVPAEDVRANYLAIGEVLVERLGLDASSSALAMLTK